MCGVGVRLKMHGKRQVGGRWNQLDKLKRLMPRAAWGGARCGTIKTAHHVPRRLQQLLKRSWLRSLNVLYLLTSAPSLQTGS